MKRSQKKAHKKKNNATYTKEEKMVRTVDDWCPNYEGGTVKVCMCIWEDRPARITIFGADDFGVEIEGSESEIRKIYDEMPDVITVKWTYDHGFKDF